MRTMARNASDAQYLIDYSLPVEPNIVILFNLYRTTSMLIKLGTWNAFTLSVRLKKYEKGK